MTEMLPGLIQTTATVSSAFADPVMTNNTSIERTRVTP